MCILIPVCTRHLILKHFKTFKTNLGKECITNAVLALFPRGSDFTSWPKSQSCQVTPNNPQSQYHILNAVSLCTKISEIIFPWHNFGLCLAINTCTPNFSCVYIHDFLKVHLKLKIKIKSIYMALLILIILNWMSIFYLISW